MNKVVLIGRLTKDPQVRSTQSGIAVTTFTLAVDRKYAKKDDGKPTADFIPVVTWRKLAEICGKNLAKGRLVGVYGMMQVRTYEQNGEKRYITEVVADEVEFLSPKEKQGGSDNGWANAPEVSDEEVPF